MKIADLELKFEKLRAAMRARQERIRREEIELERERAALVAEGNAFFTTALHDYREQAIAFTRDAAARLATVPAAPVKPGPAMATATGFDEYLTAAEQYPGLLEEQRAAAKAAGASLAPALRGLCELAYAARRRCNEIGFEVYQGLGFLREDQRRPTPGTALIDFAHNGHELLESIALAAESGQLTAAHASALVDHLQSKPAVAEQPLPLAASNQVWERITKAEDARQAERDFAARGGLPLTETQRDVARCVDGLGTNGGRPLQQGAGK